MCILNIIHRIFIRFFSSQGQIKIQLAVDRTHSKKESGSISTDFFDQLVQSDALTRTLRHLDQLTVAVQTDHLQDQNFQLLGIIP